MGRAGQAFVDDTVRVLVGEAHLAILKMKASAGI